MMEGIHSSEMSVLTRATWYNILYFLLLQFRRAVQLSVEDPSAVKHKQEYTLLAIISHKGDTPNSGTSPHDFVILRM
jgi:hypothetical protein